MAATESDEADADVVVVGAGPGGCTLSYLLARSGVETVLLERHADLDREFRGYGFMPRVLRLFDEMGLLDAVLALPHEEVRRAEVFVYGDAYEVLDFAGLSPPYDYVMLMEQPPLLELLVERADEFETFSYRPATPATDLLREGGQVAGVRATDREAGEDLAIRSRLVVGADGRYSTVRKAAGIDAGLFDSSVELLWFKLPAADATEAAQFRVNEHGFLLYFGLGGGEVQLGWFIEKGTYPALRKEGIEAFRRRLAAVDPSLREVLPGSLTGFDDCSLLHIEPGLSEDWVQDGLLLLGDAAHVASPIGGQGNALAVEDAVAAHSTILAALDRGEGPLPEEALRRYEDRRRPAVERVLTLQRRAERLLSALVLHGDRVPDVVERPLLRATFAVVPKTPLMGRVRDTFALGVDPVSVDSTAFRE